MMSPQKLVIQHRSKASPRKRAFYAIAIAVMNFFGFLILTLYAHSAFIWPTILVPVAVGLYLLSLRCPNCGNRIFKRKVKIFGEEFTYWGGFSVPRSCSRCNADLSARSDGKLGSGKSEIGKLGSK
jgi:hypothetical protein